MNIGRSLPVMLLISMLTALGGCKGGAGEGDALASARSYIGRQEYKSAIISAKNELQKHPANGEARLLLGQALLESGEPAAAVLELRRSGEQGVSATKALPLLARAQLEQGECRQVILQFATTTLEDAAASADLKTTVATCYAAVDQRDDAIATLTAATKEWPGYVPAILLHARLLAASADIKGAQTLLDELLSREPKNATALILRGDIERQVLRHIDAALTAYRAAVAASPGSVAANAALISTLLEHNEAAAARTQLEQMKSRHPAHPQTLFLGARLAFDDKDWNRTRELTAQLLKYFPEDPRILQLAAAAEIQLNALAPAESLLLRNVKAAPALPGPRQMLAKLYMRTGEPEKALEVLKPVLESKSPDSQSLTLAANAYLQMGDMAGSQAAFARAATVDPKSVPARTALAFNQLAKGNAAMAYAELESIAAADSGDRGDLALIAARISKKDLDGALAAIDSLEKKQPDKPMAMVLRGGILAQRKETAAAAASFEKALLKDPLFYPATAGLAALELSAGRPEAAKQRFENFLVKDPRNFRPLLGLAELKRLSGASKEEVAKAITDAAKASPSELAPRLLLVRYLLGQNDVPAALAAAQDAAAALPDKPEVLEQLGAAQLAAKQSRQAVDTFSKLAALHPDRVGPRLQLAEAQLVAKDLEPARHSLERVLDIQPDSIPAHLDLARVAVLQNRHEDALAIARKLQRSQPKSAAGLLLEAEIENGRGRPAAAGPALRKALILESRPETAILLHRTLQLAGSNDEARRFAATWTKDHPKDAAFHYYLGDVALSHDELGAAEEQYRSVAELQPNNALALNNIAWLMIRQQKPGALTLAERANQLLPDRPALMDTLASALAADNRATQAIELQKKAIAKAPDDLGLRLSLARIYLQAGNRSQARVELESLAKLGSKFADQGAVAGLLKSL